MAGQNAQLALGSWTPVPATAMYADMPKDVPQYAPGYIQHTDQIQDPPKMDPAEIQKALTLRQDFREQAAYPGDWGSGLFDCCAAPGGCETCLMGEQESDRIHFYLANPKEYRGVLANLPIFAYVTLCSMHARRLFLPMDTHWTEFGSTATWTLLCKWLMLM
jgi:hypothetical protein